MRLESRDADDIQTAQLVALLQPDAFLSQDKDLHEFSPVSKKWSQVSVALRDGAMSDHYMIEVAVGGVYVSVAVRGLKKVTADALRCFLPRIRPILQQVPREVVIAGIVLSVVALIHPTSRAYVQTSLNRLMGKIGPQGEALVNWMLDVGESYLAATTQKEEAHTFLKQCSPAIGTSQTLLNQLAQTLSRSIRPLTPAEVVEAMRVDEKL